MSALNVGAVVEVPGYGPGWQVWSKSSEGPGAYFVVKDGRVLTIRATKTKNAAKTTIVVISA